MKTFAIDWGHGTKLTICDGENTWACPTSLDEFQRANAPCRIVIENTFESYHRAERNRVIAHAKDLGVEILTVPTHTTANRRRTKGLEKSDEVDAQTIFEIWKEGRVHLAQPKLTAEKEDSRMLRIELLRRRKWPKKESNEFAAYLPTDAPLDILSALGDGKRYSPAFVYPLVAVALDVVEKGGGRNDFDREIGSYGHGHPSLLRSHFYYHRLRALCKRVTDEGSKDAAVRKKQMQALRRATRWVFHQAKNKLLEGK